MAQNLIFFCLWNVSHSPWKFGDVSDHWRHLEALVNLTSGLHPPTLLMSPGLSKAHAALLVPVSQICAVGSLLSRHFMAHLCAWPWTPELWALCLSSVPELCTDGLVWPQSCLATCLETAGLDLISSIGLHSWAAPYLASNVIMDFCFNFQVWGKHSFLGAWERSENENNIGSQKLFVIKTSLYHFIELEGKILLLARCISHIKSYKSRNSRSKNNKRSGGDGIYFCGFKDFAHYLKMEYETGVVFRHRKGTDPNFNINQSCCLCLNPIESN